MKLRKNSRPYTIIKNLLGTTGELLLTPLTVEHPKTAAIRDLVRRYERKKAFERSRLLEDLKRLQNRKLIYYQELPDQTIAITLTRAGKKYALQYKLDEMQFDTTRWDGRWRIILFDIPDFNKRARDAFRAKLKELRCHQLQKSVYITPWPCSNEIDFLCALFEIPRSNILLFEIQKFEGAEKLRQYFKL